MNNLKDQFEDMKLSKAKKDDMIRYAQQVKPSTKNKSPITVKFVTPAFIVLAAFFVYLQFGTTSFVSNNVSLATANTDFHQQVSSLSKGALFTIVFTVLAFLLSSYYLFLSIHSVERWHKHYFLNELREKTTVFTFSVAVLLILGVYLIGLIAFMDHYVYREICFVVTIIYFYLAGTAFNSRTIDDVCCQACHQKIPKYRYFKAGKSFTCKKCEHVNTWPRKEHSSMMMLWFIPVLANGVGRLFSLHNSSLITLLILLLLIGYVYLLPYSLDNQTKLPPFKNQRIASQLQAVWSVLCVAGALGLFFMLRGPDIQLAQAAVASIFFGASGGCFAIFSIIKQKRTILGWAGLSLNVVVIIFGMLLLLANGMSN